MVRKLARILVTLSLLLPPIGWGLGLGDIHLRSALNERLDAEIDLLSVAPGEAETISVSLAPFDAFSRAGVPYAPDLSQLQFVVQQRADGSWYVDVASRSAVREPFLDFIVELNWRAGRLLREYTLLLDPPSATGEKPPTLAAPTAARTAPAPAAPRAAPAGPARSAGDRPLVYGPVKPSDTLWSIANALRPDRSVSVHQMMMALLRANPDAFHDGNVNALKKGSILRLDDRALLTALSKEEALREFNRQSRRWQDLKQDLAGEAKGRPQQPSAVAAETPVAGAASPQPQLKLVPPTAEKTDPAAAGGEDSPAMRALRQEFARTLELTEAQEKENEELRGRLAALEEQLSSLQRLLTLKEASLAQLQDNIDRQSRPQVEPPPAEPAETVASGQTAAATGPDAPQVGAEPRPPQPKPVAEPSMPQPVAKPAPQPPAQPVAPAPRPQPVAEPGIVDFIMGDPLVLYGGGGLLAVILLLAGLIAYQRNRRSRGFQESILTGGAPVLEDDDGGGSAETSFLSDLSESGASGVQSEDTEVDPLTEADVYIAYGRHQQAQDLLKQAIKRSPERPELLVKLLEIFYLTRDAGSFSAQANAARIALGGSGPLWQKVQAMGHDLCPDDAMFSEAPEGVAPPQEQAADAPIMDDVLDIGLDLDALAAEMEPGEAGGRSGDDDELDLDLDFSGFDGGVDALMAGDSPKGGDKGAAAVADDGDGMEDWDVGSLLDDEPAGAAQGGDDAGGEEEDFGLDLDPFESDAAAGEGGEVADVDLDELDGVAAGAPAADEDDIDAGLLDFDIGALDDDAAAATEALATGADEDDDNILDFKLAAGAGDMAAQPVAAAPDAEEESDNLLDFDLGGFEPSGEAETEAAEPETPGNLLDFDLGGFEPNPEQERDEVGSLDMPSIGAEDEVLGGFAPDPELERDEDGSLDMPSVGDDDALAGFRRSGAETVERSEAEIADPGQDEAEPLFEEELDFSDLEGLDLGGETGASADESLDLADLSADTEAGAAFDLSGLDDEPPQPTEPPLVEAEEYDLSGFELGEGDDADGDAIVAVGVDGDEDDDDLADFDLGAFEAEGLGDESGDGDGDDALFGDLDEIGTKLDLATAYVEMGDADGARDMLEEVLKEGDADQQAKARELMERLAS